MWYAIAASIGTLVGCRLAYGSWPWEAHKTWYWTGFELEYLRHRQLDMYRGGINLEPDPNWPYRTKEERLEAEGR